MARTLFSDSQLERIFRASVKVLGEMGMRVQNRTCLDAMERFGCKLDYAAQRAWMSAEVLDRMLRLARADYAGWDRQRPHVPGRLSRGGGGTCPFYFDDEKWAKRRANEADCIKALKIVETSDVSSTEAPLFNCDCPPRFESIRVLQLSIETLHKTDLLPIDLFYPHQVPFVAELGNLYKSDPKAFLPRGRCPTTPLTVGKTIADLAVAMLPYGVDYIVPSMPIAGGNAPVTPMGTAVVGTAEILGGWVLAKSLDPDMPVGAVALTGLMDMKTGKLRYVAPEVFIADTAIVEVFEVHLGLPCNTLGRYIDAEAPGLQAVYEQMLRSVACGMYSQISTWDGTLDQGRAFSPTQLMIDTDAEGLLAAYTAEPQCSDDDLAVDVILKVGFHPESYLMHEHTIRHMKDAWWAKLMGRTDDSTGKGSNLGTERRLLAGAGELWRENLKKYEPPNHSDDFLRELGDICGRARRALLG